jgi:hypothetical protein
MKKWKLSQEIYLKIFYKEQPLSHFAELFGKSVKAVQMKARKLDRVKIPDWTKEEVQILLSQPTKQAAEITGRSVASCKTKKTRLSHASNGINCAAPFQ